MERGHTPSVGRCPQKVLQRLKCTTHPSIHPQELSESGIMMYDPLPPLDSTSSYSRPSRSLRPGAHDNENPLLLFLRSMLPTFENLVRNL